MPFRHCYRLFHRTLPLSVFLSSTAAYAIVPATQLVPDGALSSVVQVRGSLGSGTGSIIDKRVVGGVGYLCVLTADHVAANASNLRIGFGNGTPGTLYNASLLGGKGPSGLVDIAVLKVEFGQITPDNSAAFSAITPMSLATPPANSSEMVGKDLSFSGYGRTGDPVIIGGQPVGYQFNFLNGDHAYGTKRFANNRVRAIGVIGDAGSPNYLYQAIAWELDNPGLIGEGGIMSGDSGGPVLMSSITEFNGTEVRTDGILGVLARTSGSSYKGYYPEVTSSDLAVYLNADYQAWIRQQCELIPEPSALAALVTAAACAIFARKRSRPM